MKKQDRSNPLPMIICIRKYQNKSQPTLGRNKTRKIEPIQQTHVNMLDSKAHRCKSDRCDSCLTDYFHHCLHSISNQISDEQKYSLNMGRASAIVTSPNISIDNDQMSIMLQEALDRLKLEKNEIRQRYAIIHMNNGLFILGGFLIDPNTRKRIAPKSDYFFDNQSKQLKDISPLPGGLRMDFGVAVTDNDQIIVVGGHDASYHSLSCVDQLVTKENDFVWQSLPNMPNGMIGAGASVIDNILYVMGGFDLITPRAICHGDAFCLNLKTEKWDILVDLDPPRARPLIAAINYSESTSLIIAGGYSFDSKGKAIPHPTVEEFDPELQLWRTISQIPNFEISNGLVTRNNRLYLMDTGSEDEKIRILNEYNLITKRWENPIQLNENEKQSQYSKNSKSARKIKGERSIIA